jgi:hypothetical protein
VHCILLFLKIPGPKFPAFQKILLVCVNKTYIPIYCWHTVRIILHVGVPGLQIVHTLNMSRALDRCHVTELSRRSNLLTIDYVGEGAGTNTWKMYKL